MSKDEEKGNLKVGEIHPCSHIALRYIKSIGLAKYLESIASCALSGNRTAEICHETLRRLMNNEPVSDRYLMGLGWFIWNLENE